MKKLVAIFLLFLVQPVYSEEAVQQPVQKPVSVIQNINFANCTKIFEVNQEKLFYLTLASLSANKFNIDEMQTAGGYIIFSANRNKYLATIAKVDNANSILKITPCNNIYNFHPGIVTNTFKYIDLNLTAKI